MTRLSQIRKNNSLIENSRKLRLFQIILFFFIVFALHDLLDKTTPTRHNTNLARHNDLAPTSETNTLVTSFMEPSFLRDHKKEADNINTISALNHQLGSWKKVITCTLKRYLDLFKRPAWLIIKPILIQANAIRLLRLEAPIGPVQAGQPIKLRCLYETTRGDKLQSLSWYKNGREFYRYQPFERRQPVLAFNLTGVYVDMIKSKNSTVILANTTSETTGRYKCEATGTSFQEVKMETFVNVITASSSAICFMAQNLTGHFLLIAITLIYVLIS